eukprot:TRINITY_DN478_c0_g1_i1.p1 TRINITY_DN478_c0_g1~~TRINITY_DN478_c0_g1_i1.p1  ORF type:complete len:937 (-),score=201.34 TRINITY_DN478_c0_g1_i1:46-2856(-)
MISVLRNRGGGRTHWSTTRSAVPSYKIRVRQLYPSPFNTEGLGEFDNEDAFDKPTYTTTNLSILWDDVENHYRFFQWMAKLRKVKTYPHWIGQSKLDIDYYSDQLLSNPMMKYDNMLFKAMDSLYPAFRFWPWFWAKRRIEEFHNIYFDAIGYKHNIEQFEDFERLDPKDVTKEKGEFKYFTEHVTENKKTVCSQLTKVYPHYPWKPWLFDTCDRKYWQDKNNVKLIVSWLGYACSFVTPDDWYSITHSDFSDNRVARIKTPYDNSLFRVVSENLPELNLKPWRFNPMPKEEFWNPENTKEFFEWFKVKKNIVNDYDWCKVTYEDIKKEGGAGILDKNDRCLGKALAQTYPEKNWPSWVSESPSAELWSNPETAKQIVQWMGEALNIKSLDDWHYHIASKADIINSRLTNALKEDFYQVLSNTYPDFPWKPWCVSPATKWTKDDGAVSSYLKWIEKELCIDTPEKWLDVTPEQVERFLGGPLIERLDGLWGLATKSQPSLANKDAAAVWKSWNEGGQNKKLLLKVVAKHLQSLEPQIDYSWKKTKEAETKVDVYFAGKKVAIDASDAHPFIADMSKSDTVNLESARQRLVNKEFLSKKGISLITLASWPPEVKVPSLIVSDILSEYLSNLVKNRVQPVPKPATPTNGMQLPESTLWDGVSDVKDFLLSPLYKGIRVYWNGKNLFTANKEAIDIPSSWSSALPGLSLEGVLCYKNGQPLEDSDPKGDFSQLSFKIYDDPYTNLPLLKRLERVKGKLSTHPNIELVTYKSIKDNVEAVNDLEKIAALVYKNDLQKGAGIVLRHPALNNMNTNLQITDIWREKEKPLKKEKGRGKKTAAQVVEPEEAVEVVSEAGKGYYHAVVKFVKNAVVEDYSRKTAKVVKGLMVNMPSSKTAIEVTEGVCTTLKSLPPPTGSSVKIAYTMITKEKNPRDPNLILFT